MLKLVIFDFDGVLFNSAKYYVKTRDSFFKRYNIKFTKKEHKENLATTSKDFLKYVFQKHKLNISYNYYFKEKTKIFYSFLKEIKMNPGVLKLLKDLKKNKVKIALSSSNEKVNVMFFLKRYKIDKYFDLILTLEDVKKHKPHPEPFLKPCKLLKIKPEECIGIEDAIQGIVSLKKGNIKSVALISDLITKKDFKKIGANLIVKSLKEVNYKKLSLIV